MSKLNAFLKARVPDAENYIWRQLIMSLPMYSLDRKLHVAATMGDVDLSELKDCYGLQNAQSVDVGNPYQFDVGYQASHFLSKLEPPGGGSSIDADYAAQEKFLEYEAHCRAYNREGYRSLFFSQDSNVNLYVGRMQSFIRSVIGDVPNPVQIVKKGRHGPGSSALGSSQFGHRYYKNTRLPYEVSARALPYARVAIKHDDRWRRALEAHFQCHFDDITNDDLFVIVNHERVVFVVKKPEISRTIGIGPTMNLWLQLGAEGVIRAGLKARGIDLNDQSINQRLALQASITNLLSTLDLRGASDTTTLRVVEKLFPYYWVELLDDLRLDSGIFPDGTTCHYEKLSAMGNGTTFAVEALLFAAAMYAIRPDLTFGRDMHVYGDDIVFPTSDTPVLMELLTLMGFQINEEKSFFSDNHVRESCGKDYVNGYDVRPVFLRKHFADMSILEYVSLHNQLYLKFCKLGIVDPGVCKKLRSWVKDKWLLLGPPTPEPRSDYFFVPDPLPGTRTTFGMYYVKQLDVKVKEFNPLQHDAGGYFYTLNAEFRGEPPKREYIHLVDAVTTGDRTLITRRNAYQVKPSKHRRGASWTWPANPLLG